MCDARSKATSILGEELFRWPIPCSLLHLVPNASYFRRVYDLCMQHGGLDVDEDEGENSVDPKFIEVRNEFKFFKNDLFPFGVCGARILSVIFTKGCPATVLKKCVQLCLVSRFCSLWKISSALSWKRMTTGESNVDQIIF